MSIAHLAVEAELVADHDEGRTERRAQIAHEAPEELIELALIDGLSGYRRSGSLLMVGIGDPEIRLAPDANDFAPEELGPGALTSVRQWRRLRGAVLARWPRQGHDAQ